MMIKKYILLSILFVSCLTSSQAQEVLSLEKAIKTGLENNFQISISDLNKEIASNNNRWGATGFLPSISANLSNDYSGNNLPDSVKITNNSLDAGITMNWTVFNGFKAVIGKEQLSLLEDLSAGSSAIIVENTIQGVILAYYNILLQEQQLSVLEILKSISGDKYQQFLVRQELGTSVTFEVLQSKNEYLSDSSNFLLQQLNLDNAYRNLNLLMAVDLETPYSLSDSLQYISEDFSLEGLMEKAFASNKTLQNQYINTELLKKDVRLASYAFLPKLTVNGSVNKNLSGSTKLAFVNPPVTIEPAQLNPLNYYVGFTLNLSLFNGGNRYNALKNAVLSEEIGQLQKNELEFAINNQLLSYYHLYLTQQQVLEVAIENEKAASLNLEIAQEKYDLGILNSFNFRDIQLAYLNTAFTKYQSIYNIIQTHTELVRLSGGLITEN